MTEPVVSLVEFYRQHGISPVRQDISNLEAHFARRAALYRHLGILPAFVTGRTVLEIGPGSGFNSLYTAALGPRRYVLVEPNPAGVADIERLFAAHPEARSRMDVIPAMVDDYQTPERFDFVFCEGLLGLSGLADPAALLGRVAALVAPGGLLVITCVDAVSLLAETLRRLLADRLSPPDEPLDRRLATLEPVFGAHLSRLGGVSRRHDDWVVDNLINPASIGPLFSIPQAIEALDEGFDAFGASPKALVDWRWYKSITTARGDFNAVALEAYWREAHNLLDCRVETPSRPAAHNRDLHERCRTIRAAVRAFETSPTDAGLSEVAGALTALAGEVGAFAPSTAAAIQDAASLVAAPDLDADRVRQSDRFGAWFGRGQQYLSFSRALDS